MQAFLLEQPYDDLRVDLRILGEQNVLPVEQAVLIGGSRRIQQGDLLARGHRVLENNPELCSFAELRSAGNRAAEQVDEAFAYIQSKAGPLSQPGISHLLFKWQEHPILEILRHADTCI